MKTIYLLARIDSQGEDCILGAYSSKSMSEAARLKYRSDNPDMPKSVYLSIRPIAFDSPPEAKFGFDWTFTS